MLSVSGRSHNERVRLHKRLHDATGAAARRRAQGEMARPAVFLDRDGTVIVDRHFAFRPDAIELVPGAVKALRRLRSAGYLLVLVTNQSGVARGYFDEEDVRRFHHHLQALLARQAAPLDA